MSRGERFEAAFFAEECRPAPLSEEDKVMELQRLLAVLLPVLRKKIMQVLTTLKYGESAD